MATSPPTVANDPYESQMAHWHPVSSSNVEAIRMAGPTVLAVRFKARDGRPATTYHYYGQADMPSYFWAMLYSASKGKYVHEVLRRQFPFSRIS